ncbi:MAG: thermonuclease family protein [Trichlorobacter sp.]|nr:thermonuclease family protein [Trichlorobacter sp.]
MLSGFANGLFSAVLAVVLLVANPAFAKQPIRVINGTVTKVADGDTIHVTDNLGTKVKIRFYGIDAPETAKGRKPGQPYGDESTQLLRQKVDRQQVRVDVMDIDMYRRLVAIVWLGNRNINREMVAEGGAWAYRRYLDRAYASEWIADEDNARRAGKGLWR